MHTDAEKGQNVLIADDLLATVERLQLPLI